MTYTAADLHGFLQTRRSVRRFQPQRVPEAVLQKLLLTAAYAPSAHNRQPWRFAVLTDPTLRTRLAEAMAQDFERDLVSDGIPPERIQAQIERSRDRMVTAPAAILLCLDRREMDPYPDEKRSRAEHTMAVQSAAAAGLQLLLAAHAEGLAGVWVCSPLFAQETIRKTLNLPEAWEPQALYFLGYPEQIPEARQRKPLQEIAIFL